VIDRKKMEGHCSTCQNPQWAVVQMGEEEVGQIKDLMLPTCTVQLQSLDLDVIYNNYS